MATTNSSRTSICRCSPSGQPQMSANQREQKISAHSRKLAVCRKRIDQSLQQASGKFVHAFKTQTLRLAAARRQVCGAEKPVPQTENHAEIFAMLAAQNYIVMPYVHARRIDDVAQKAPIEIQVGMVEMADERRDDGNPKDDVAVDA